MCRKKIVLSRCKRKSRDDVKDLVLLFTDNKFVKIFNFIVYEQQKKFQYGFC